MHNSSSHRVESPAQPSMHEDVVATNNNALVAYQAPEYRGEPLSIFERQVLHRQNMYGCFFLSYSILQSCLMNTKGEKKSSSKAQVHAGTCKY